MSIVLYTRPDLAKAIAFGEMFDGYDNVRHRVTELQGSRVTELKNFRKVQGVR
jgi:hypothetical protein